MQWRSFIQSFSIHTQKQSEFDIFNEYIEIDDNNTHGSSSYNSKTTTKTVAVAATATAITLIAVAAVCSSARQRTEENRHEDERNENGWLGCDKSSGNLFHSDMLTQSECKVISLYVCGCLSVCLRTCLCVGFDEMACALAHAKRFCIHLLVVIYSISRNIVRREMFYVRQSCLWLWNRMLLDYV